MFVRELTVLPSDASCRGQMKLHSLLNHLQDTASLAVVDLEGTPTQLQARGYAWILTRYELEIMGPLPTLDDRFTVGTFHDPDHGYGTLRVFQVNQPDGTPLAWAKTSWLLLDLAAGRPVRPIAHLPRITERDNAPINPDFRDIPPLGSGMEIQDVPWHVRFHDLDSNGHVNNAAYFEWIFEATPIDLVSFEVRQISASFRSSARWGDRLRIRASELPSQGSGGMRAFSYRIVREPDGGAGQEKPMTSFSCTWEPCRP